MTGCYGSTCRAAQNIDRKDKAASKVEGSQIPAKNLQNGSKERLTSKEPTAAVSNSRTVRHITGQLSNVNVSETTKILCCSGIAFFFLSSHSALCFKTMKFLFFSFLFYETLCSNLIELIQIVTIFEKFQIILLTPFKMQSLTQESLPDSCFHILCVSIPTSHCT